MRPLKSLISILLLSFFGLSLTADVFALDSHLCMDEAAVQISNTHDALDKVSAEGHHQDCSDPCHYGRCHLGHCSITLSDDFVQLKEPDSLIEVSFFNPSLVDGPFLEGLRRPPRFS